MFTNSKYRLLSIIKMQLDRHVIVTVYDVNMIQEVAKGMNKMPNYIKLGQGKYP